LISGAPLPGFAEHQALCREHHAVEPAGKGPVIAVVDESGSMQGAKAETAKALALALAWVARRQRRWWARRGGSVPAAAAVGAAVALGVAAGGPAGRAGAAVLAAAADLAAAAATLGRPARD